MAIRFESLGIHLDYIPKSFEVMGYEISILGILLAVSMMLGVTFVVLEAKRRNQNQDFFLGAVCMAIIGAVIGGRLFYVVFSWNLFKNDLWEIIRLRNGGMAFYGALIGGSLFVALLCKIRKISFGETADTLILGVLIVQIFVRLGDFFNRESFGQYTEWPTAMQIPLSAVRASEVSSQMRENLLTIDGSSWIQVHPTAIYECLWCILIFLILMVMRRKKLLSGEIFMKYLAWYGLGRFFIEYLRTDQLWIPETTYPICMILAAVSFILFTIVVAVSRSMAQKRAEAKKRRMQEYEEQKAIIESDQPVDIEELLREEEEYQKRLAREAAGLPPEEDENEETPEENTEETDTEEKAEEKDSTEETSEDHAGDFKEESNSKEESDSVEESDSEEETNQDSAIFEIPSEDFADADTSEEDDILDLLADDDFGNEELEIPVSEEDFDLDTKEEESEETDDKIFGMPDEM